MSIVYQMSRIYYPFILICELIILVFIGIGNVSVRQNRRKQLQPLCYGKFFFKLPKIFIAICIKLQGNNFELWILKKNTK